ncbi:MAG: phage antirepressor N-terminal domain-containing protein, partial [Desulfovibrionaceae bacterium]|nr:phage antirepressor N-terminal domain-containing protein [Desulfovibrionaceae bacterium]
PPLKPLSDLFGLRWERQRQKVTKSAFYSRHLGVCTLHVWGADGQKREQTCILVPSVAAYLLSINPDLVRAQGNESGADYLEAKIVEWNAVIHEYEEMAGHLERVRQTSQTRLTTLMKAREIALPHERQAITRLVAKALQECGEPVSMPEQQALPGV